MKTVAVISQKGGAGKTTLALHLAVAAESDKRSTVIVDLDPQASAANWKDLRASSETPVVVSAQVTRLPFVLDAARNNGASLVIIDTAPHSESAALAAARAADLILIPCRPAILDIRAIHTTVDLLRLAGKPGYVVLNAVPPRGGLGDDAAGAIDTYGVPIAPVRISQRAAYIHALTGGRVAQEYEPNGKAGQEVLSLYKWICRQVKL